MNGEQGKPEAPVNRYPASASNAKLPVASVYNRYDQERTFFRRRFFLWSANIRRLPLRFRPASLVSDLVNLNLRNPFVEAK